MRRGWWVICMLSVAVVAALVLRLGASSAPVGDAEGRASSASVPPAPVAAVPPSVEPIAPTQPSSDARPMRGGTVSENTDIDAALVEHAKRAGPRWRRTAKVLAVAIPADYEELAHDMAARVDAAAKTGLDAPHRQELINEERQLVEHLRRRYEGIPEIVDEMDALEADLAALESIPVVVGPSPDPRERQNGER